MAASECVYAPITTHLIGSTGSFMVCCDLVAGSSNGIVTTVTFFVTTTRPALSVITSEVVTFFVLPACRGSGLSRSLKVVAIVVPWHRLMVPAPELGNVGSRQKWHQTYQAHATLPGGSTLHTATLSRVSAAQIMDI